MALDSNHSIVAPVKNRTEFERWCHGSIKIISVKTLNDAVYNAQTTHDEL